MRSTQSELLASAAPWICEDDHFKDRREMFMIIQKSTEHKLALCVNVVFCAKAIVYVFFLLHCFALFTRWKSYSTLNLLPTHTHTYFPACLKWSSTLSVTNIVNLVNDLPAKLPLKPPSNLTAVSSPTRWSGPSPEDQLGDWKLSWTKENRLSKCSVSLWWQETQFGLSSLLTVSVLFISIKDSIYITANSWTRLTGLNATDKWSRGRK